MRRRDSAKSSFSKLISNFCMGKAMGIIRTIREEDRKVLRVREGLVVMRLKQRDSQRLSGNRTRLQIRVRLVRARVAQTIRIVRFSKISKEARIRLVDRLMGLRHHNKQQLSRARRLQNKPVPLATDQADKVLQERHQRKVAIKKCQLLID